MAVTILMFFWLSFAAMGGVVMPLTGDVAGLLVCGLMLSVGYGGMHFETRSQTKELKMRMHAAS